MARYTKDFQCAADPQAVFNAVSNYLYSENFQYENFDGENVFKKGNGVLTGPCFFRLVFVQGYIRLESWMKYALLPGVFIGELDSSSLIGSGIRGIWKKRLTAVEDIIASYGALAYPYALQGVFDSVGAPAQSNMQTINTDSAFCTNCGYSIYPGNINCPTCGAPVNQTQFIDRQNVSRKEFIEKYISPSERRNINSVCYLCYFCAVITAVMAIIFNPFGLIDAAVLGGIALGMQLTKNRVFSFVLLAFTIFEFVITVVAGATPPIWWLAAGIASVVFFNKIEKKYKQFKGMQ